VNNEENMEAPFSNAFSRIVAKFEKVPAPLRRWARSKALGSYVKFAGTASIDFEEISTAQVICRIRNVAKNQNHIKGVHAAAMALLAETATGFAVGMNLPDDKLPLLKSMKVEYKKRAQGDLKAVAALTAEQIANVRSVEKGDVTVPVTVTDESGNEPIQCEMVWAWVPKKRN
jgi:acyl-coenzyme A thioesterase PaaI-like protein